MGWVNPSRAPKLLIPNISCNYVLLANEIYPNICYGKIRTVEICPTLRLKCLS